MSTPIPDIWFVGQRVIRTLVAGLVVFVPAANLALPMVASAFNSPDVPAEVYLAVNAWVLGALAVLGVITKLMAIPKINAWLTKVGAGSVPSRAALTHAIENGTTK